MQNIMWKTFYSDCETTGIISANQSIFDAQCGRYFEQIRLHYEHGSQAQNSQAVEKMSSLQLVREKINSFYRLSLYRAASG